MIQRIPDPNVVFPNSYGTTCFLKNVITAPNILVGDYTYYGQYILGKPANGIGDRAIYQPTP